MLALGFLISLSALSCYDIQYTLNADGDSPYLDQQVSVHGVVIATGYNNHGYFIADPQGGAWSGLYIYNNTNQPQVGDMVMLSGTVAEYYNLTEITQVFSFQVLSQNNPLPQPAVISTAALASFASAEQWEGCLVQVQNATVSVNPNAYQEFYVSDGSGDCQIDNVFFPSGHSWNNIQIGLSFASLTGVVDYAHSSYALNPRWQTDLVSSTSEPVLILPNLTSTLNTQLTVALEAHNLYPEDGYDSYSFQLNYDPALLQYQSFNNNASTLSYGGTVNVQPTEGNLQVSYQSDANLSGNGVLLNFIFLVHNTGFSTLTLSNALLGDDPVSQIINGSVRVNGVYNAPGDTLTLIQRPILNVPAIQIPGETMSITCLAPQTTTGFNAWLVHGLKRISLPMLSSTWQSNPDRWELSVSIPQVNVFELYDLEVNASGGLHDISQNAVQVVPSRKTSYYFVHITDLHMPTRIFYPDAGFDADSLSVVDFRAVMDDINLIRPEFVLLTGDLINEGELEGFANQYHYGWVQRVISELEVPVFVTAGNHDIGGWNSTPPPAGSSRRNWWRYFGWSWLDNDNVSWPYHTQDYYFTYNNMLFVGLESYDNYDYWRQYIYGNESYTDQQLAWLNNVLGLHPNHSKVLFHHYDFQEQLNLNALDIDLSLWGHIHSNSGSIYTQPYDLSTRSTCDGNRAYRVIRVNNEVITPHNSIYAGSTGANLSISYSPSNYGVSDTVSATIVNGQPLAFENALVKFIMPAGTTGYDVSNGVIEQIERTWQKNICYVRVNLPANGNVLVSLAANGVSVEDENILSKPVILESVYPNPVKGSCTVSLNGAKASSHLILELYNLKGQKVQQQSFENLGSGANSLLFSPSSQLASGIYFLKVQGQSQGRKLIIMR